MSNNGRPIGQVLIRSVWTTFNFFFSLCIVAVLGIISLSVVLCLITLGMKYHEYLYKSGISARKGFKKKNQSWADIKGKRSLSMRG